MSQPTDVTKLNLALAHALGVTNVEQVQQIDLQIRPLVLPKVTVHLLLRSPDGLKAVVDEYALQPGGRGLEASEVRDAA